MLNFYLPSFYNHYDINEKLLSLFLSNPEFFRDDIRISSIYDTFPGAIWNGGRVSLCTTDRNNIISTIAGINNYNVAIRYTFTNQLLQEHHMYDTYCNLLMDCANNGKNEVLLNSQILEEYLRKNYPNFKYISSTTKCILDIGEFNEELEKDYYLVVLDFRKNRDLAFLDKIKNKDKVEILINAYCSPDCIMRKDHYEYLSRCQLNADVPNNFCDILSLSFFDSMQNKSFIKVDELFNEYVAMGFSHFKIEGRTLDKLNVIESLVYYLVIPEYKDLVRFLLLRRAFGLDA